MKTKLFSGLTIKDAAKGEVSAVFATFNTVDADGDYTLSDAFEAGAGVVISAYGHKSWEGALPVGKGTIRVTETEAIMDGQFFLNTTNGRETFDVVKELGLLQEWSYSLHDVVSDRGEVDGRTVNFLRKVRVKETSPVLMGAGVATRTIAAKNAKAWAEMGTFEADIEAIRTAIEADVVPDDLGSDEYAYVSIAGTFTDHVVATFRRSGEDPVTYQYGWSRSDAGDVELSDRTEVDLTMTVTGKDTRFADHSERLLHGVKEYIDRAAALAALRVNDGRAVSAANCKRFESLEAALREAADELGPLSVTTATANAEAAREFVRFISLTQAS